jgi:prepilin peptidase CpaA
LFDREARVIDFLLLTVFPGIVAFAGAMDLLTLTIPNRISLALIVLFFALAPLAGLGATDISMHVIAGFSVLVISIGLFSLGWFGGGDAKLLSAVALWVGFEQLLPYLLYVALAGGAVVILFLQFRSMPLPRFALAQPWAVRLHDRDGGVPYGLALAAGAFLVYPQTSWFAALLG